MQKLEKAEKAINEIKDKRKQEDIKTCYANLESLSHIEDYLNKLNNRHIKGYRDKLIDNCKKEKELNIEYIINLSYKSFMDQLDSENTENELQQLVLDIQKSSFYSEYKNKNVKIQLMELMMPREKIDYRGIIKKLQYLQKKASDKYLYNDIKDDITNCEIEIANKEFEEVKELLKNKEFGTVLEKMQKLLKEITTENIKQETMENYLKILENIIETQLKNGDENTKEINIFEEFLKKNKYYIDNYHSHKKKLKALKECNIDIKEKKNIMEMKNENISFILNNNDNNFVERDRNKVEDYLKEIQKCIPETDLIEFRKCKEYIYEQISNFEEEEKNGFINSSKWVQYRVNFKKEINDIKNIGKIYSFFNQINKRFTNFDLHTIQLISLLILSKEKTSDKMKGVFCKINTGEGKSTIIQFFAAYKVLCGNKVDIVSSSPVLAERDAKDEKKKFFYNCLNISVKAVTDKDAYKFDIVYGDTTHFSADILLQDYEFIEKRGKRNYDVVIIDEVDSMCIDNLATKTQLTKKFSGAQSLYTFYYVIIYVFNFIAFEMKLTTNRQEIEDKRYIIKKAILQRLMGDTFDLDNKDEDGVMRDVDKYLLEKDREQNQSLLNENTNEEVKQLEKKIQKLITKDNDGKTKLFEVDGKNIVGILYPNCLKEEIETHLENWIDSVITSFSMVENIDYRIDMIKERYKRIIPVDFSNTGVSQTNMVWNDALHQILQIINDVEVFPENINTNFLLIISFFRKYKELYGLTGTIGSEVNQETLQNLYNVELYFIPPNLKSQLKKRSELFFTDEERWQNKIINEIKEILMENRSVLLICSSIKVGENFENILKNNGINNIKKYFTEEHKNVVEEVLEQNYVIIATNLAGRGTDIKISKNLEEAGGLHVIVSFIPINQRVEDQNYGRAGRNGQKGSYSLIFKYNSDNPVLTVELIKKRREEDERKKVKYFRENELNEILEEETLFNDYCKYRKDALNKCKNDFIKEDNEYYWGKILDSKECMEKKKKMLEDLKKRSLSVENIQNPLIKIKDFIQNIDKFEENDKKIFQEEKFYSWPLKMEYAKYLSKEKIKAANKNQKEKENEKIIKEALEYYEEVIENIKDFQIDIQNQTILFLFIFRTLEKNNNLNQNENEKPKIEAQNERKKNILQAIIDIIKKNIETLNKFQEEKIEGSYIETSECLTVQMICKKNLGLDEDKNKDEVKDLHNFIKEFGIEKIEIIRIVNKPNFWKNYLVLAVGVIEVAVGAVILFKAGTNQKCRQLAFFLIKQGFNDIVESFQKALEGKEINLKEWGLKKASEYATGILSIATGNCIGMENTLSLKNEIAEVSVKYAIQKASSIFQDQLVKEGGNQIQELFSNHITKPMIERVFQNYFSDNKFIVMDLVNNDKYFEEHIIQKTFKTIDKIRLNLQLIDTSICQINQLSKKKSWLENIMILTNLIATNFPKLYAFIQDIIDHFNIDKDFIKGTKGNNIVIRFDGSLRTLVQIKFQSYDDTNENKINEICQQLIEYNVINKEGKIDINQIDNKELNQGYLLQIDNELKEIESSKENYFKYSDQILGLDFNMTNRYINYINEVSYNFDKKNIEMKKEEIYNRLTREALKKTQPIIDFLVNFFLDKYKEHLQKKDIEEKNQEKKERAKAKVKPQKKIKKQKKSKSKKSIENKKGKKRLEKKNISDEKDKKSNNISSIDISNSVESKLSPKKDKNDNNKKIGQKNVIKEKKSPSKIKNPIKENIDSTKVSTSKNSNKNNINSTKESDFQNNNKNQQTLQIESKKPENKESNHASQGIIKAENNSNNYNIKNESYGNANQKQIIHSNTKNSNFINSPNYKSDCSKKDNDIKLNKITGKVEENHKKNNYTTNSINNNNYYSGYSNNKKSNEVSQISNNIKEPYKENSNKLNYTANSINNNNCYSCYYSNKNSNEISQISQKPYKKNNFNYDNNSYNSNSNYSSYFNNNNRNKVSEESSKNNNHIFNYANSNNLNHTPNYKINDYSSLSNNYNYKNFENRNNKIFNEESKTQDISFSSRLIGFNQNKKINTLNEFSKKENSFLSNYNINKKNNKNNKNDSSYSLLFGNNNKSDIISQPFGKKIQTISPEYNNNTLDLNYKKTITSKQPKKTLDLDFDDWDGGFCDYSPSVEKESKVKSFISKTVGGVAFIGSLFNPLRFFNSPKNEINEQSSEKEAMENEFTSIDYPNFNNKKYKEKENNIIKPKNVGGIEPKRLIKESSKKNKKKHKKMPKYKDKKNKELSEKKSNELSDKICNTLNDKKFQTSLYVGNGIISYFKDSEEENKKPIHTFEEIKNLDNLNINQLSSLKKKEMEEKSNKKEEEENREKNFFNKGTIEWNRYKRELIETILKEINYLHLIEEIFENYIIDFRSDINEKISQIFNNDFKDKYTLSIQEKHHSIFLAIKNSIPEIETLNLIIIGLSGAGKSTLTNIILKDDLSEEGNGIHSVSQTFKKYSNPNKIPGITIYDTIGIEPTNKQRNLEKIKKMIQDTFDENLEDPQNSLHSILYCISNGVGSNRIGNEEIQLIGELNKLYGKNDILTIVFTQSLNNETEKRKNQLQNYLNNENIEIIDILAKDYTIKIGKQNIKINAFGLDKLIASIKKNAKKVVIANLKQIAKIKMKKEYIENTNTKYNEIKKKIRNHQFERTFTKECEFIIKNLFDNFELKFYDIEKVISKYIIKLKIKIINELKTKNKEKIIDKINEGFIIFNAKHDNLLKQNSNDYEDYIINENIENYFKPIIDEEVNKILLENGSLIFMENIRKYFSEIISENVKDEEIEDLAASNVEKILKKINN